jgi:hypothetical protein
MTIIWETYTLESDIVISSITGELGTTRSRGHNSYNFSRKVGSTLNSSTHGSDRNLPSRQTDQTIGPSPDFKQDSPILVCNAFLINIILLDRRASIPIQLSEPLFRQRAAFPIVALHL